MFSKSILIPLKKDHTQYRWMIVFLSMLMVFFSAPGQSYFLGGFTDSYIEAFKVSRTQVSLYYSLATLVAGFTLVVVGKLIDRYGQRRITLIVGSLLGATCLFNATLLNKGWMLVGSFFMLRLLGQGSMVLIPSTLIPNWFDKDRAIAMSYVAIGAALGSFLIPLVHVHLFQFMTWRGVWIVWSILLIGCFIPIIYGFLQNAPANNKETPANSKKEKNNDIHEKEGLLLKEATKTPTFWFLTICQSIPAFINTGLFIHITSIMKWNGLDQKTAMIVMSIIGMSTFIATIPAGRVLEKFKENHVMMCVFIVQALSIVVLMLSYHFYTAIIFGILTGFITGFQNVTRRVIWPNYYGKRNLGTISGFTMTALVIGSAISPLVVGALYDHGGTYRIVLIMMGIIPLIGALLAYWSPRKNHIY